MSNEMHSLLAKYFNGEATAEENERVHQWIAASEENRAEFQLLQKLWNSSGQYEEISFDTTKAWQSVNAKINTATLPAKTVRMFSRRTAIAAAAAVILLLGLWWLAGRSDMITVYADAGTKTISLEDGSVVYLRKGSSVSYSRDYGEELREVSMEGEAFFDVKRDTAKPFRIIATLAAIEVLGTSFNVNAGDNQVELVVKTGLVRFGWSGNEDSAILVSAGERGMLEDGMLTKSRNTDANFNAWQSKQLVFNNTPLPQVMEALNDYYDVRIRLKSQDSAQLSAATLTAQFNDQSLSSVFEEISLITSYRVQRISEGIYEISIQ
jgi:transmembrane sensor